MKNFLYHFRISLLLSITLASCYVFQIVPKKLQSLNLAPNLLLDQSSNLPIITQQDDKTEDETSLDNKTDGDFTSGTPVIPPSSDDPISQPQRALLIKAINPGYTIDGTQNVGEFIELQKNVDIADFSLAGYGVRYTNSSGKGTLLLNFSEGSLMTGETLLMRLARSPESDRADATYMTTLAMTKGQIELLYHDEVVDSVCWGTGENCLPSFKSASPTTLLRDAKGGFAHIEIYEPIFNPEQPSLVIPAIPEPPIANSPDSDVSGDPNLTPSTSEDNTSEFTNHCYNLEFSEIHTYYANNKTEQFIELYNASDQTIVLNQCKLRYKKKIYELSGEVFADGYYTYYPARQPNGFSLTKNPTSSNMLEILDVDDTVVDMLVYNHGQKKSTSYARFYTNDGSELWDATYALTPGAANVYQEFRTCPTGKVINPDTGNCVNVATSSSSTTTCPEGKYLNPLTGRCKKIEDTSNTLKECAEGYERNPETNRCRKIKIDNSGAEYALIPNTSSSKSVFIAASIVALLVSLGIIYIVLQFRHEIARAARKTIQRFKHIRKNLLTRGISFHRKK